MIILFGTYRLGRRRLAYRNDFCLSCEEERISEQHRTFDLFHIFWIPLLPLGFRKRWHCTECGNNPHERVKTSKPIKIAAVVLLAIFSIVMWTMPIESPDDAIGAWVMRILVPAGLVAMIISIVRDKGAVNIEDKLQSIAPLEGDTCHFCGGYLQKAEIPYCPDCNARRY